MCQFVYAFLPATANVKAASLLFEKHKRAFKQIEYLPPHKQTTGDVQILTTRTICDCGTVLGCYAESKRRKPEDLAPQIAKLRKRGWSETKIARWKADKDKNAEIDDSRRHIYSGPYATVWRDLISDVLQSGATERLGILVHWGHDLLTDVKVAALQRESVPFSALTDDQLLTLEEEVIYWYTRAKAI